MGIVSVCICEGGQPVLCTLQFQDDDISVDHNDINPSKVVAYDWKKLCKIWKSVNADYKPAVTKFMCRKHSSPVSNLHFRNTTKIAVQVLALNFWLLALLLSLSLNYELIIYY